MSAQKAVAELDHFKASTKKQRSARFSQTETDLLCSLVVASDLNTNVTNKPLNNYGRVAGWNDIATVFNASPGVLHRPVNVLKERVHNIRKDLNKLAAFAMSCTLGKFEDHLQPKKPPKVSFELSTAVKEYAAQLQIQLEDIKQICSNATLAQLATVQWDSAEIKREPHEPDPICSPVGGSLSELCANDIRRTTPAAIFTSSIADIGIQSTLNESDFTKSDTTRNMYSPPSHFFAIQNQPKRRRVNEPHTDIDTSSQSSSSPPKTARENYYEQKTEFLANENARRSELHAICVDIKKEELAIKRKQSEFWDLAVSALHEKTASFSDVANVANFMQRFECPVEQSDNALSGICTSANESVHHSRPVVDNVRSNRVGFGHH